MLSRIRLFVIPWTVVHQAPLSIEFSKQEYQSGLPFPSPGNLPDPGIKPRSPALQADSLPTELQGKPKVVCLWLWNGRPSRVLNYLGRGLVTHPVWFFCDPVECSPPGSSVHGISQARILEWVITSFSRGSSPPRDQTWISCLAGSLLHFRRILYLLRHLGSPTFASTL